MLINNAGLGYGGPIRSFSSIEVTAQLDLNIVGTIRAAKAILLKMRAQNSGLIIQLNSGCFPGLGVYHAGKWGLEGLSESMRYKLAPLGIDVVIVWPDPFSINFFGNIVSPQNTDISCVYQHVNIFLKDLKTG